MNFFGKHINCPAKVKRCQSAHVCMNLSEQHVTLKQMTHENLDTMFIDIKYEVNKYRENVRQGKSIKQIYALLIPANNYMPHILKPGSKKMFPCIKTIFNRNPRNIYIYIYIHMSRIEALMPHEITRHGCNAGQNKHCEPDLYLLVLHGMC